MDVDSPTEAAEDLYLSRGHTLDEYLRALPRHDHQCGAIVCIGGRLVCLDFVDRPDVFAGLYPKLLRGYALDALERPADARCRSSSSPASSTTSRPLSGGGRGRSGRARSAASAAAASSAPSSTPTASWSG